jgi:hypothetical protein
MVWYIMCWSGETDLFGKEKVIYKCWNNVLNIIFFKCLANACCKLFNAAKTVVYTTVKLQNNAQHQGFWPLPNLYVYSQLSFFLNDPYLRHLYAFLFLVSSIVKSNVKYLFANLSQSFLLEHITKPYIWRTAFDCEYSFDKQTIQNIFNINQFAQFVFTLRILKGQCLMVLMLIYIYIYFFGGGGSQKVGICICTGNVSVPDGMLSKRISSLPACSACFEGTALCARISTWRVCSVYAPVPDSYAQRTHHFLTRLHSAHISFWRACSVHASVPYAHAEGT